MADASKYGFYQDVFVQQNTDYTFSIDVYTKLKMECRALTTTSSGGTLTITGIVDNSGWDVTINDNSYNYDNRRYSKTFNTGNYKAYRFFIYGANLSTGADYSTAGYVNNPQLEIGTKATDWAPSPLDVESKIDDVESQIDEKAPLTIIREYNNGVLVGKVGQSIGSLVNANGSFDIVNTTWNDDVPSAGTILAKFGTNSVIGKTGESRLEFDYHSIQLMSKDNAAYFYVSDLRDTSGWASFTETYLANTFKTTTVDGTQYYYHDLGMIPEEDSTHITEIYINNVEYTGSYLIQENHGSIYLPLTAIDTTTTDPIKFTYYTSDNKTKAFTFGSRSRNSTIGAGSVAMGYDIKATNTSSAAFGFSTEANGAYSFASGLWAKANGWYSHAEGYDTEANGFYSHAEGYHTEANSSYSHAEGGYTQANGIGSHAGGYYTIANNANQTAIGKYNKDNYKSLFIVGNGTSDSARSNAFVVNSDGSFMAQNMVGMVIMYAGSTVPNGWLLCDGSEVYIFQYPELNDALGGDSANDVPATLWGTPSVNTKFKLPDFRGRAPIGAGTGSGLTARTLGDMSIGSEAVTLTSAQSGNQALTYTNTTYKLNTTNRKPGTSTAVAYGTSITATNNSNTIAAKNATSAHNNMQPSAAINFIIATGKTYS